MYLSFIANGMLALGDPCAINPTTWNQAVQYTVCLAQQPGSRMH